jgi:hypothetical protein
MGRDTALARIAIAARPGRPLLTITVPSRAARFLIAAGAQAAESDDSMTVHFNDMRSRLAGEPGAVGPARGIPSSPHETTSESSAAVAIATADPSLRLAARGGPLALAVVQSNFIVRFIEVTERLRGQSANTAAGSELFALESQLNWASEIDDELARAYKRACNNGFREAIAGVLYHVDRNGSFARARMLAEDVTHDLARAMHLDRGWRDRCGRERYFARILRVARELALSLASNLGHGPVLVLVQDRIHARDLARNLARNLRTRDLARARSQASVLDRLLVDAMSRSLGLDRVEGLASALLKGALDDFTQADLSNADLASVDLNGVKWSMSTRWPPDVGRDDLIRRSRETAPRSGIFVVSSPSGLGPVHEDVYS